MSVKLLTIHHLELEFLSVKGDCTGSSESTLVKMSNCWKSHVAAQLLRKRTYCSGKAPDCCTLPCQHSAVDLYLQIHSFSQPAPDKYICASQ